MSDLKQIDRLKLAQRTISMLSSMIGSGECHTTRSKEMQNNAIQGLEDLLLEKANQESPNFSDIRLLLTDEFIDVEARKKALKYAYANEYLYDVIVKAITEGAKYVRDHK